MSCCGLASHAGSKLTWVTGGGVYILVSSILLPACLCAPFTHHTDITKHTWQLSSGSAAHTSVNQSEPATDWLLLGNVAWWLHDCLIAWSHTCKSASTGPLKWRLKAVKTRKSLCFSNTKPSNTYSSFSTVQHSPSISMPWSGLCCHKISSRIILLLSECNAPF